MQAVDIIREAFQGLRIVAVDEAAQAHDYAYGKSRLDALFLELRTFMTDFASPVTVDTIPEKYRIPLADLLGCDLAPAYDATPVCARQTAMVRLRAAQNVWADYRDGMMDLDDDGTVEEDETIAFDQGAYF